AYVLTAPDGTVYDLDAAGRLVEETTAAGAHLFFSDSGITASDGTAIQFQRDAQGRITRITGPDGTQVVYSYDAAGNLVAVRDLATGAQSRYGYGAGGAPGLSLVLGAAGQAGTLIQYGPNPNSVPITADLGGASRFLVHDTSGTLAAGGTDR